MLSKLETQILKTMKINQKYNKDVEEILNFEKKYNKNSLEILNKKENLTADLLKWQLLVEKAIYFNFNISDINTIKEVTYLSYSNKLLKKDFPDYLNEVLKYKKHNPNTIFILSNSASYYKKILAGLNQREITTLFITDNIEDLKLDYTNTIIRYSENPRKELLRFPIKFIKFNYEEVGI